MSDLLNRTANVLPIVVPRSYFEPGNWPGPYRLLRHPQLGIAWVILGPRQTMLYVNHEQADLWQEKGINWREDAKKNLIERSRTQLWTHELQRAEAQYTFISFMHEDGLGPSRVLLREDLERNFGKNYKVAIPDRSCALVFPLTVGSVGDQSIESFVADMHSRATTPMLPTILSPEQLEVEAPTR
jgi:hypothetical protein